MGLPHEEKGDFPCCCRIQLSALRETTHSVDPLLFLSPSTFLNGPRCDGSCFTATFFPLRKWVFIQCFGALSQKSGFKVVGSPPQKGGGAPKSVREGCKMLWCVPLFSLKSRTESIVPHLPTYMLFLCFYAQTIAWSDAICRCGLTIDMSILLFRLATGRDYICSSKLSLPRIIESTITSSYCFHYSKLSLCFREKGWLFVLKLSHAVFFPSILILHSGS